MKGNLYEFLWDFPLKMNEIGNFTYFLGIITFHEFALNCVNHVTKKST